MSAPVLFSLPFCSRAAARGHRGRAAHRLPAGSSTRRATQGKVTRTRSQARGHRWWRAVAAGAHALDSLVVKLRQLHALRFELHGHLLRRRRLHRGRRWRRRRRHRRRRLGRRRFRGGADSVGAMLRRVRLRIREEKLVSFGHCGAAIRARQSLGSGAGSGDAPPQKRYFPTPSPLSHVSAGCESYGINATSHAASL